MSDDDIFKPGAIEDVLRGIAQGHDVIIVNAEVQNSECTRLLMPKVAKITEDRVYSPGEDEQFFIDAANLLSYIGATVVKKSFWQNRPREPYYGTDFLHVGVIFQKPIEGTALLIAKPLISQRYGVAIWSPRRFEVSIVHWPSLIWSFHTVSETAKRRICLRYPWESFRDLTYRRATAAYTFQHFSKYVMPAKVSLYSKMMALVISLLPGVFTNLAALIYYTQIKKSEIAIVDLKGCAFYPPNRYKRLMGTRVGLVKQGRPVRARNV